VGLGQSNFFRKKNDENMKDHQNSWKINLKYANAKSVSTSIYQKNEGFISNMHKPLEMHFLITLSCGNVLPLDLDYKTIQQNTQKWFYFPYPRPTNM